LTIENAIVGEGARASKRRRLHAPKKLDSRRSGEEIRGEGGDKLTARGRRGNRFESRKRRVTPLKRMIKGQSEEEGGIEYDSSGT